MEFDLVVDEIRGIPGYEDFLQMVPFSKLQSAAREGPVIIITMITKGVIRTGSYGLGHAIIVLDAQEPVLVALGEGRDDFVGRLESIVSVLREIRENPGDSNDKLETVLKEIGELIVKDIVKKLRSLRVKKHSRIWWCPTSVFSAFPIHAAMWREETEDGKTRFRCLADFYVSSYTPSLTALIHARSAPATRDIDTSCSGARTSQRLLLVGQPDEALVKVDKELEDVALVAMKAGHTPDSLVLFGGDSDGERDKILECLRGQNWIHFACHGILDAIDPFGSHFQISDGTITLMDIVKQNLPNAELAFLSACHSAEQPENIVEGESLHLAAAIQFAGFRSVVGTIWPLNDYDGPRVAKEFYEYMFAEPKEGEEVGYMRAARALNKVTRSMRREKDYKRSLERWVNFVHIGA